MPLLLFFRHNHSYWVYAIVEFFDFAFYNFLAFVSVFKDTLEYAGGVTLLLLW